MAVPLLVGILVLATVLPGAVGQVVLWLLVAVGMALYFVGWRLPLQYLLTNTHLCIRRGLISQRWVPLDQIQVISRVSRDDEIVYAGFCALGDQEQPVIINPHRPPQFRVAFTPSEQFLDSLFWATGREEFDQWPVQAPPVSAERL